jgi:hypothetical protein
LFHKATLLKPPSSSDIFAGMSESSGAGLEEQQAKTINPSVAFATW